jgi:folate-binding protein YgfZ
MAPDLFNAVEKNGACVDLSTRCKLLISGADRVRYLNGQLTNDVRKASAEDALYACVTSVKGRIEADVFLHASPAAASLLLDAEAGLREALALRLEKYVVADDVSVGDVTDEWKLLHVFGPATARVDEWCSAMTDGVHRVNATRLGEPGVDLWMPSTSPPPAFPGAMLSADEAETLRILRGIPRWPHELNAGAFPQEAGLETRAMDFTKGCYIGQEILSRIKTTGKMPRTLVSWAAQHSNDTVLAQQLPLPLYFADSHGARHEAGIITSATRHPLLGRWVGLGFVRQGEAQAHSVLLAGDALPSICIDVNYLKA